MIFGTHLWRDCDIVRGFLWGRPTTCCTNFINPARIYQSKLSVIATLFTLSSITAGSTKQCSNCHMPVYNQHTTVNHRVIDIRKASKKSVQTEWLIFSLAYTHQTWMIVLQVIKMLLTIIVVFFVCWGPKLVVNIMKRFELSLLHSETAFFVKVTRSVERHIEQ